jgi:hypothetical protein
MPGARSDVPPSPRRPATDRAIGTATVVGLAVAVLLATAFGGVLLSALADGPSPTGATGSDGDADADDRPVAFTATVVGDVVRVVHRRGRPLDVRAISLTVYVDGTPLDRQPPIPFFSAPGFVSAPTGPFNPAADPRWSRGEAASVTVADANGPGVAPGDRVTVVVSAGDGHDGEVLARASATADPPTSRSTASRRVDGP